MPAHAGHPNRSKERSDGGKRTATTAHPAFSVINANQDDFWLNIGLVFPHKDNGGFNIMLQAFRSTADRLPRDHRGRRTDGKRDAPTVAAPGPERRTGSPEALNGRALLRPGHVSEASSSTTSNSRLCGWQGLRGDVGNDVDDEEPQLLTQEIARNTVATIDDALAVIRQAIEKV